MGTFTYPAFAVCVVIYNIVAALGSFLCSWLAPAVIPEKTSANGMCPAHYSLLFIDEKTSDPLSLFPGARLQNELPCYFKDQLGPIDSRTKSIELQSSVKENKNIAT